MPGSFVPGQAEAGRPLLLVCSTRRGNSLTAALNFAGAFADAQAGVKGAKSFAPPRPVMLHDYETLACFDCGLCAQPEVLYPPENPARLCPLAARDESAPLFAAMLSAPWLAIFAPIYFYHLPARLKAMLDRCQLFYNAAQQERPFMRALPERRAYIVLSAARERGEQLFTGSLLSLKYALAPMKFGLQSPLLLYGLENKADLAGRPELLKKIRQYGHLAGKTEEPGKFEAGKLGPDKPEPAAASGKKTKSEPH